MKHWTSVFLVAVAWLGISSPALASDLVSLCTTCTTPASFQNAAKAEIGRVGGTYDVLVVNPDTKTTMLFSILFNPNAGGGSPQAQTEPKAVAPGKAMSLSNQAYTGVTARQAEVDAIAAAGPGDKWQIDQWNASSQEAAEVGAIIDLTKTDQVIVMPNSDYYGSFVGRNAEATSLEIFKALTEKNPAWAGRGLKAAFRQLLSNKMKQFFGKDPRVCAVFNNGDSACFEINFAAPSADKYIAGTARAVDGSPLPDAGSGSAGGGGDPMVVDWNPPNVAYGARGSTGRAGEVWLFCATSAGVVLKCWLQVL
ncbi:hypothetical protein QE400_000800 [Xanthomonas sacchari]|uniref:hypothetical protein n=1 Tax=Xanthomonas sacchari TaxID=56458 RepID=UPI00277F6615|nr:hypothetical protein [Xanthomonas sacchari]MDQ1091387.1 hypothetical protein [Xanthomonas sacchari]